MTTIAATAPYDELALLLHPFDVDVQEIWRHADVGIPGAAVLLGGTFNQKLATATSDVDLLIVLPNDSYSHADVAVDGDAIFPLENSTIVNRELLAGQKLQLHVVSAAYLNSIQDYVSQRNSYLRNKALGAPSLIREGRLLYFWDQLAIHRLYTGLVLKNQDLVDGIKNRLTLEELSFNVGVRETSAIQGFKSDVSGLVNTQDEYGLETVIHIHNRVIISTVIALLASKKEISPQEKLLFRLLYRLSEVIGKDKAAAIANRVVKVAEYAARDPMEIFDFAENTLSDTGDIGKLIRAERSSWEAETRFSLFQKR